MPHGGDAHGLEVILGEEHETPTTDVILEEDAGILAKVFAKVTGVTPSKHH